MCVEFPSELDSGRVPLWVPSVSRQTLGGWDKDRLCLVGVQNFRYSSTSKMYGQAQLDELWESLRRLPPLWAGARSHHSFWNRLHPGALTEFSLSHPTGAFIGCDSSQRHLQGASRLQAGCQVCGRDLDCPTEQGAEKQPELLSDWDVTGGAVCQRQERIS